MAFMRDPYYILMQDGYVDIVRWGGDHGGLHISQATFDEIITMRYYNMTEEERRAAIDRVLATQFETGADGVRRANGLPTVMERVEQALGSA